MDELRLINNLEIIEEINNAALKGKLKCNCGCNEFYIYHTGKQTKGILSSDIVKHKKQVVINAQCVNCKEIIKKSLIKNRTLFFAYLNPVAITKN